MPTLHQMLATVQGAVEGVVGGLIVNGNPYVVDVGIGWPPENRLQDVVRLGGRGAISVYDRKVGRNTTRWNPYDYNQIQVDATLTTAISGGAIVKSNGSQTITLGGTASLGDAVSAVLVDSGLVIPEVDNPGSFQSFPAGAAVVVAGGADTPSTMAAALAAAIDADATLSTWVSAAAAGPVVTIAARAGMGPFSLSSYTGNGATATREIGRRERQVQVACWTNSEEARNAVCDPISVLFAQLELNFGPNAPDGTPMRLTYGNDYDIEDGTLQDAYRRDFLITLEYPVTTIDNLYAILAPEVAQFATF